jgi:hypothetical protein
MSPWWDKERWRRITEQQDTSEASKKPIMNNEFQIWSLSTAAIKVILTKTEVGSLSDPF